MSTTEIVIFSAVTLFNIWFSWKISLKEKRYHGISRFFSFESNILLFILNYSFWFENPFSIHQVISWILLIGSAVFAIIGYTLLSKHGHARGNFENTSSLITSGTYKYIRHPMYFSLLLLGFGIMLKHVTPLTCIVALVNMAAVYTTARIEEKEMILKFGDEYREYMKTTKMFIPFIF